MTAWFKTSELRMRIGIITDYYLNYIELQDMETLEYYIVHESKVELIKIRYESIKRNNKRN